MVSDVAPLLDPKHPRGVLLMVILGAMSAVVVAHMLAETGLVPAFLAAWPTPPMDGWWAVGGLWMANSAGSIVVETMLVRMAVGVFAVAVAHAIFVFVAQPTVWAMVRAHKAVCSATTIASAPSAKAVVVLQDHADVRSTEDAHKESHSSWEHQDNDVNIIARDTRDLLDELFIFGFHAVSLAVGYEQYRASTYYPLFEASSGLWQDEGSVGDLTYALAHAVSCENGTVVVLDE